MRRMSSKNVGEIPEGMLVRKTDLQEAEMMPKDRLRILLLQAIGAEESLSSSFGS